MPQSITISVNSGSAGSDEKVRFLRDELGFDAAFNYKETPPDQALRQAAPDGIDIYFDNVGGDHLQAAINAMKPFGRIPLCGMISTYNATTPPPGPNNLMLMVAKRLTMRGFLVGDHADRKAASLPSPASGRGVGGEGVWGGTGLAVDPAIAAEVVRQFSGLVMLAGGLRAETVAGAVRAVRPWGVDVSSGVETDGAKDEAKITAFVAAAKGAV
jgi:hypothetical protein